MNVVVEFNWPEWRGTTRLFPNGRDLADAPVADAARLATTFVRGERFCDGAIQEAIEQRAAGDRWFDDEYPAR